MKMHHLTLATLREAGWHPGRAVDTGPWEERLKGEGYTVGTAARRFLGEYGGLVVSPPRHGDQKFGSGRIRLDPAWAFGCRAMSAYREAQLGVELCAVGEWETNFMLFVGTDGRVFADDGLALLLVGDDLEGALDLMISAFERPPILFGEFPID